MRCSPSPTSPRSPPPGRAVSWCAPCGKPSTPPAPTAAAPPPRGGARRRGDRVARRAGGDRWRVPDPRHHGPLGSHPRRGGTTNRTHLKDYETALTPASKLLLKVHQSNFQVTGFTAQVSAQEIASLGRGRGVASLYDLGSGLLLDLAPWGLAGEPTVPQALASGMDAVAFSGDKLLGGPQAGILLGTRAAIEACRNDPLARAVLADKPTLAALEATLTLYRDPDRARGEIPVLRMLTEDVAEIRRRGEALQKGVGADAELVEGESEVGGGSFPGAKLKTWLVRVTPDARYLTPDTLSARLRASDPPIIARIGDDRMLLDPRTTPTSRDRATAESPACGCSAMPPPRSTWTSCRATGWATG